MAIEENPVFAILARSEAASLAKELNNFTFLCLIVMWFNILSSINEVSKLLQSQTIYLPDVVELLESSKNYLETYRSDNGFEELLTEARTMALEMEIEPVFPSTVQRKKKRLFSYERQDDPIQDPQKRFQVECFYTILDVIIKSVKERFEQLKVHSNYFQFLYDIRKLKDVNREQLLKSCMELQEVLTDVKTKDEDIDGMQLCEELIVLAPVVSASMKPIDVLGYAVKNGFAPNVAIALRILLTLPITVASGERSFSKLKIIKNYLRSSMSQERLVGLATLSIENAIAQEIDFEILLKEFANAKARKVNFL
ncbi:zinc finger MYM-type protein 1-like [Lithobates pipiens]